jgi:hypothetical protein
MPTQSIKGFTTIPHRTGLVTLTDEGLALVVSMAINANRTGRTFSDAWSEGGLPEDIECALSKSNTAEGAQWLIQNVHALAEGLPRPPIGIEDEYHHAIIDDAWAMQAAAQDEYVLVSEDEGAADAELHELENTVRRLFACGDTRELFRHLDRIQSGHRAARRLIALSNAIGCEIELRFAIWDKTGTIQEPEFRRTRALLQEQEHCLYVINQPEKLAENLVRTAAICAQTSQFHDSIVYVHRALIHSVREGLPRWQCLALSIKLSVDSSFGNVKLAEESQAAIRSLVAANSEEPWTDEMRPYL